MVEGKNESMKVDRKRKKKEYIKIVNIKKKENERND